MRAAAGGPVSFSTRRSGGALPVRALRAGVLPGRPGWLIKFLEPVVKRVPLVNVLGGAVYARVVGRHGRG